MVLDEIDRFGYDVLLTATDVGIVVMTVNDMAITEPERIPWELYLFVKFMCRRRAAAAHDI